jgi:SagB-type dehydrogenase family enzyme
MAGIGKEFMKKTQFEYLTPSDQMQGVPHPLLEVPYEMGGAIVSLPPPSSLTVNPLDLRDAIEQRRSVRQYSNDPITLAELAFLLWCTQGVRETVQGQFTFRTVPSAGARHALETYILVNNVEELKPGIYRYLALEHQLADIPADPDVAKKITAACVNQQFLRNNGVTFFWTAVAYRMTWRYGERGYRYLHIDSGHACQNLYLAAQAVGCGVCAVGAFHDTDMNALLQLDGEEQFLVYIAAVGKTH